MIYTDVSAPRFANAEGSLIDCLVVFPKLGMAPTPYTAAELDPDAAHSEEIFRRCLAGEFGPVAPFEEVQPVAGGFDVEATGADDGDEPAPRRKRTKPKPAKKRKPERLALLKPRTRRAAKPRSATRPPKRKR